MLGGKSEMAITKKMFHRVFNRFLGGHSCIKLCLLAGAIVLLAPMAVYAQSVTAGAEAAPPPMSAVLLRMIPMFVIVFGIFYFLVIKPQKQEIHDQKKLVEGLKKGDRVVTTGGIIGQIVGVEEQCIVLGLEQNARMKVEKRSIARKFE